MDALDVLVIGRNCVDYIAVVDRFPKEDEKIPLSYRMMEGGGQGGTAACCIAKLGGRVMLAGNLGGDDLGRYCLRRLKDFNVNTDLVHCIADGCTPIAYLFVTGSNGKRTIIYENSELPGITVTPALSAAACHAKAILLAPDVTYLAKALTKDFLPDVTLIYDCERWRDGMETMMAVADYFIPTRDFLYADALGLDENCLEDRIRCLADRAGGQLIVTCGEDGAYFLSQNVLYHVPAPAVTAVDTIGAGDNFHGAFALAVAGGADLFKAVRFSVATASLSCTAHGGRNGVPDLATALAVAENLPVKTVRGA